MLPVKAAARAADQVGAGRVTHKTNWGDARERDAAMPTPRASRDGNSPVLHTPNLKLENKLMVSSKQTDMADKKGRPHTKSSLASELEQGRRRTFLI